MEKYKNLMCLSSIIIMFFLTACDSSKKGTTGAAIIPDKAIQVTVTDYRELDGCEFLLITADGKKLQPVNLDEKLKRDGIQLYITYKIVKGMGICMAGEMVELIFSSEIKGK